MMTAKILAEQMTARLYDRKKIGLRFSPEANFYSAHALACRLWALSKINPVTGAKEGMGERTRNF